MIRRPPRSTLSSSSAASDVYKRQLQAAGFGLRAISKHDQAVLATALTQFRAEGCFRFPPENQHSDRHGWALEYQRCYRVLLRVAIESLATVGQLVPVEQGRVFHELCDGPLSPSFSSSSFMNLFNYGMGSLGIHKDRCLLTVIYAIDAPVGSSKLWVRHPESLAWQDTCAAPGEVAVLVGEELELLAGGAVTAAEHCVTTLPGGAGHAGSEYCVTTSTLQGSSAAAPTKICAGQPDRVSAALVLSLPHIS
eukprot:TRINITY_DN26662_c0_g1_i2.p1 TRINITY_DN26662_c0_g1~~TRINITY_DN26662_c0_g1_i2.p1  ORF type:complete len:251 (+),score=47.34 TRINITY_DN26662_c0_g1_i2:80-832(+)